MAETEILPDPPASVPAARAEWRWFPVLVSAGVFPGAGQWLQGHKVRALLIGGGTLIVLVVTMLRFTHHVQHVALDQMMLPVGPLEILSLVLQEAAFVLPGVYALGVLWLWGVLDAVLVAHVRARTD